MHNLVEDTFVKFALIRLFLFKSVLLKIIPLFSLAGVILTVEFFPECKPTPLKVVLSDIVF